MPAPFPINSELTAIAIGYQNSEDSLIADQVLPRVSVASKFDYMVYDTAQAYTVPDTRVGRKSEPNQVSFSGTAVTVSVEDYGLQDLVPESDMATFRAMPKAPGAIDPMQLATMMLTNLILLDREVRVANTVFNAANYDTANKDTLSGTDQWSDFDNSDPVKDIMLALDVPLVRPNALVLGRAVWTTLRRHPKMLAAIYKNDMSAGAVSVEAARDFFEVDRILVGNARVNTARKGQAASYQRTWGKHCAALYISTAQAQLGQPTWGFTGQFGTRVARDVASPKTGLDGGTTIIVGEKVKEVVSAKGAGYFFENAIA